MANRRCRMHGGTSTGPRTPEGLQRCQRAAWKHGRRSAEAIALRKQAMAIRREMRRLMAMRARVGLSFKPGILLEERDRSEEYMLMISNHANM
jgi:hypothetical protein